MARSDEAEWWFNAVYAAVQEIPHGKVTSYGHIALLLGHRKPPSHLLSTISDIDNCI
jgi:methylated-DNA-protein-cysteine methyltransferase-like protein